MNVEAAQKAARAIRGVTFDVAWEGTCIVSAVNCAPLDVADIAFRVGKVRKYVADIERAASALLLAIEPNPEAGQ